MAKLKPEKWRELLAFLGLSRWSAIEKGTPL